VKIMTMTTNARPWRATPYAPPRKNPFGERALGQTPVVPGSVSLMDSPLLALSTDVVAAAGSGYLAYGYSKLQSSTMSTIWLVVATAMTVKALHDLSRLNA
jgi:hypothetical protein